MTVLGATQTLVFKKEFKRGIKRVVTNRSLRSPKNFKDSMSLQIIRERTPLKDRLNLYLQ